MFSGSEPIPLVSSHCHDPHRHIPPSSHGGAICRQGAVHKQKKRSKLSVSAVQNPALHNVTAASNNDIAIFGTRGLLVPAYSNPAHYHLSNRPSPPSRPLLPPGGQSKSPSNRTRKVAVRLYHCETLCDSSEFNRVPGSADLISGAVAFLGACELRNSPPGFKLPNPNSGWVGLNLERDHGGFHLHYPGYVGSAPFDQDVAADWDKVIESHACLCPDEVLLIGVGLGRPGERCQSNKKGIFVENVHKPSLPAGRKAT
ncbi:hypothetical protein F4775DRAFT_548121 [Biscogniauxia sp. FL1348]|nr:hypothetical protein F4775DRAFT_548121 [Biscogniauxia sp. FL1348]